MKMAQMPQNIALELILDSADHTMSSAWTSCCNFAKKVSIKFQSSSKIAQICRILIGAVVASLFFQFRIRGNLGYEDVKMLQILKLPLILELVYAIFITLFSWTASYFTLGYMGHTLHLMRGHLVHHFLTDIFLGFSYGYGANTLWIRILQRVVGFGNNSDRIYSVKDFLFSISPFLLVAILAGSRWLMHCYPIRESRTPAAVARAQRIAQKKEDPKSS